MSYVSDDIVVKDVVEKLKIYPHVAYRITEKSLEIAPPNENGFEINLYPDDHMWVVCFGDGGMHEHFFEPSDAVDFIGFGLSENCRLREIKQPLFRRVRVETMSEDKWQLVHEVGMISWPWPFMRSEQIFQNCLIVSG